MLTAVFFIALSSFNKHRWIDMEINRHLRNDEFPVFAPALDTRRMDIESINKHYPELQLFSSHIQTQHLEYPDLKVIALLDQTDGTTDLFYAPSFATIENSFFRKFEGKQFNGLEEMRRFSDDIGQLTRLLDPNIQFDISQNKLDNTTSFLVTFDRGADYALLLNFDDNILDEILIRQVSIR